MEEKDFKEMVEKIHMHVNVLKQDINIHCDKSGGIITFTFMDDDIEKSKQYEFVN